MVDVTLDVPDLPEPGTGRLISIPEQQSYLLNKPFIRKGRYIEPGRGNEVLISEAFAKPISCNYKILLGQLLMVDGNS